MSAFENLKNTAGLGLLTLTAVGCGEDAASRKEHYREALSDRYRSFEIAKGDTVELRPFKDPAVTVAVTLDDNMRCPRVVIDDQGSDANYSLMSFGLQGQINPPYIPHLGLSPNKEGPITLNPYYDLVPNLVLARFSHGLPEVIAIQVDRGDCFGIRPDIDPLYFPVAPFDRDWSNREDIQTTLAPLPPTFSARVLPKEESGR